MMKPVRRLPIRSGLAVQLPAPQHTSVGALTSRQNAARSTEKSSGRNRKPDRISRRSRRKAGARHAPRDDAPDPRKGVCWPQPCGPITAEQRKPRSIQRRTATSRTSTRSVLTDVSPARYVSAISSVTMEGESPFFGRFRGWSASGAGPVGPAPAVRAADQNCACVRRCSSRDATGHRNRYRLYPRSGYRRRAAPAHALCRLDSCLS